MKSKHQQKKEALAEWRRLRHNGMVASSLTRPGVRLRKALRELGAWEVTYDDMESSPAIIDSIKSARPHGLTPSARSSGLLA